MFDHRKPPRLWLIVVLLALGGCTATVDTACQSFSPITFSASHDSAETIRQVRSHNAAFDAICGR